MNELAMQKQVPRRGKNDRARPPGAPHIALFDRFGKISILTSS